MLEKRSVVWKKYPRTDKVEWLCEHGIGHGNDRHGCDGCCKSETYPGLKPQMCIYELNPWTLEWEWTQVCPIPCCENCGKNGEYRVCAITTDPDFFCVYWEPKS